MQRVRDVRTPFATLGGTRRGTTTTAAAATLLTLCLVLVACLAVLAPSPLFAEAEPLQTQDAGDAPAAQDADGDEDDERALGYWAYTFEESNGWLALIGGILLIGLAFVARSTVLMRLRRFAETTPNRWEEALAVAAARILLVGFLAAGILLMGYVFTDYFFAEPEVAVLRDHAFNVLLYLALLYVAFELIGPVGAYVQTLTERTETKLDEQLARFATYALRAVVIVVGVFLLFDLIGAPFVALVVGLSIVSAMLLLVGYDAARNVSSSFQLLADAPFAVGDVIRFGEGTLGAVRHIGLRATQLESPQRTRLTVPNHELARHTIENLSRRHARRVDFHLDLARSTGAATVTQLIDRILEVLHAEEAVGRERDVLDPETNEVKHDPDTGEPLRQGVDPLVVLASIESHGLRLHIRYDLEVVEYVEAARIQQTLLLQILEALEVLDVELVGPGGSTSDGGATSTTTSAPAKKKKPAAKKRKKSSSKKKSASKNARSRTTDSQDDDSDDENVKVKAPSEANGSGQ